MAYDLEGKTGKKVLEVAKRAESFLGKGGRPTPN